MIKKQTNRHLDMSHNYNKFENLFFEVKLKFLTIFIFKKSFAAFKAARRGRTAQSHPTVTVAAHEKPFMTERWPRIKLACADSCVRLRDRLSIVPVCTCLHAPAYCTCTSDM